MGAAVLLAAAAVFSIGGSMAYFRAETEASDKVNAGNLGIELVNLTSETDVEQNADGIYFKSGMPGDTREKQVYVKNVKDYDLYLRVVVTKFWEDKDGIKDGLANAEFIELVTKNKENWIILDNDENHEVVEFYYKKPLKPGERTDNVLDEFKVSDLINSNEDRPYFEMTTNIQVHADAVQAIGAKNAILAEWGLDVRMDADGTITEIRE